MEIFTKKEISEELKSLRALLEQSSNESFETLTEDKKNEVNGEDSGEEFKCQLCNLLFSSSGLLEKHLKYSLGHTKAVKDQLKTKETHLKPDEPVFNEIINANWIETLKSDILLTETENLTDDEFTSDKSDCMETAVEVRNVNNQSLNNLISELAIPVNCEVSPQVSAALCLETVGSAMVTDATNNVDNVTNQHMMKKSTKVTKDDILSRKDLKLNAAGSGAAAVAAVRLLSSKGSSSKGHHSSALTSPRNSCGTGRLSAREQTFLSTSSRNNSYRHIQPTFQQQRDQMLALKEMMQQSSTHSFGGVEVGMCEAERAIASSVPSPLPLLPKIAEMDPNESFTLGNSRLQPTKLPAI